MTEKQPNKKQSEASLNLDDILSNHNSNIVMQVGKQSDQASEILISQISQVEEAKNGERGNPIRAGSFINADLTNGAEASPFEADPGTIQIGDIQMTWKQIMNSASAEDIGVALFRNIFDLAPEALDLFSFRHEFDIFESDGLKRHVTKVIYAVDMAVQSLDRFEEVKVKLQELGFKHARLGIQPAHYKVVGRALLNLLRDSLGSQFTKQINQSWSNVYTVVADTMMSDLYTNTDIMDDEFTPNKLQLVREVWNQVMMLGEEQVGRIAFDNLFSLDRDLIDLFSFGREKNYLNSNKFKTQVKSLISMLNTAIYDFDFTDEFRQQMKTLGLKHAGYGVEEQHYDVFGQALLLSVKAAIGESFTFEIQRALTIFMEELKKMIVGGLQDERESYLKMYKEINLTPSEIEELVKMWKKQIYGNMGVFGSIYFRKLFEMYPEIAAKVLGKNWDQHDLSDSWLNKLGLTLITKTKSYAVALEEPDLLYLQCKSDRLAVTQMGFSPYDYYVMKEAAMLTMEHFLKKELTGEQNWAITKSFKLVVNFIHGEDVDKKIDTQLTKLTVEKKRCLEQSWRRLKKFPYEVSGPIIYKCIFDITPSLIEHFPFKDQKNYLQNSVVKKQSASVVTVIGKAIESLDNYQNMASFFTALGREHDGRKIKREYHYTVEAAVYAALTAATGPHFCAVAKNSWQAMYWLMSEKMLKQENYDHIQDMVFLREEVYIATLTKNPILKESNILTTFQHLTNIDVSQKHCPVNHSEKAAQIQIFSDKFTDEVDFHHMIAYRFEKQYRLGKNLPKKERQTLNLDIMHKIGEFNDYIQQDSMSLFYILFFAIYYRNVEIIQYIRDLISKSTPQAKSDRLLEILDTHGVDKIRTVGEPINNIVYHMVFYQAVDDELRVVYYSIFKQMRFIQLRDSDAVVFLKNRDYEIIKQCFEKFTTKLNIEQYGYCLSTSLKCHSYRKYNQAFFEEMVINYDIEERVAMNYRQRFLVTADDIFITFEMYCKEDYDEQFVKTTKSVISEKQFVHLFITCLRNDSFKIAMIIYMQYLDRAKEIDSKMLDIVMNTIKQSVRFHEIKLFFIHEHFDELSIRQMDDLVTIYTELLVINKDIIKNPLISQYNTIKVSLLIYQICWKIEQKQIYSLITKCTLLQEYLVNSLCVYFDKNTNILTLKKFMQEPILSLKSELDCFDIMQMMNLQKLLEHPTVTEVVNFLNDGRFSVTQSNFNVSVTFSSLVEYPAFSSRRIYERMIQNIDAFIKGTQEQEFPIQSSIQFHIWKNSMEQRQYDEMVFIILRCVIFLIYLLILIQIFSRRIQTELAYFGGSVYRNLGKVKASDPETMLSFCSSIIEGIEEDYSEMKWFEYKIFVMSAGCLTTFLQQLVTYKVKFNVPLNYQSLAFELAGFFCGIALVYNNRLSQDTLFSDICSPFVQMSVNQSNDLNNLMSIINSADIPGKFQFKYIASVMTVIQSIQLVLVLTRAKKLGESVMMFLDLLTEIGRFFFAIGLVFSTFLVVGRILFEDIMEEGTTEPDKYWHVALDLFTSMTAPTRYHRFTLHTGQIFILLYVLLFRILIISLSSAMVVNRYKRSHPQLDSLKRLDVIRNKNSKLYDSQIGAISMTFFPLNLVVLPFILPLMITRSKRISDFLLKVQYSIMIVVYTFAMIATITVLLPILYVKMIANSFFIVFKGKRTNYKGEKVVILLGNLLLAPVILAISVLVDVISLPRILFKDQAKLEHKYHESENPLSEKQVLLLDNIFTRVLTTSLWNKYKGKGLTLLELMEQHRGRFGMVSSLHDLTCRGLKDYKQALDVVQDYNMMKILSKQSSIPDLQGNHKNSVVYMDLMRHISFDLQVYNNIDVLFRKIRLDSLSREISQKEHGSFEANNQVIQEDEDNDEFRKVPGVLPIQIGPDGLPLKRNKTDYMNFLFINLVVRSFTDAEKEIAKINQVSVKQELKNAKLMADLKTEWKKIVMQKILGTHSRFDSTVRDNFLLQNGKQHQTVDLVKAKKQSTRDTGNSGEGLSSRRVK